MNEQFDDEPLENPPNINYYYDCYECGVIGNKKSKGFTHLMKLVLCGKNEKSIGIIKDILAKHPEELNKSNECQHSALDLACLNINNGCSNIEIVKLLLEQHTIDINRLCENQFLIFSFLLIYSLNINFEVFKLLLNHPTSKININSDCNTFDPNSKRNYLMLRICQAYDNSNYCQEIYKIIKYLLNRPDMDYNKTDDTSKDLFCYINEWCDDKCLKAYLNIHPERLCKLNDKELRYMTGKSIVIEYILNYTCFKNIDVCVKYFDYLDDFYPLQKYAYINLMKHTKYIIIDKLNDILYRPNNFKQLELNMLFDKKNGINICTESYKKLIWLYDLNTQEKIDNFIKKC